MKTVQGLVGHANITLTTYSDAYEDTKASQHLRGKGGLEGHDLDRGLTNSARNQSKRRMAHQGANEVNYFPITGEA